VIGELVVSYPRARTIHLVLDNLNIHCRKSLTDRYGDKIGNAFWNRLTIHYTPKHGSWLNQAEIEISLLSRQLPGNSPDSGLGHSPEGNSPLEPASQPPPAQNQLAL